MGFTNQEIEHFFSQRRLLGMKPGLERMQKLLELIGNPHEKIRAIHVAGTNGKGSTIHYIRDCLIANGYQTGVFTSPSMSGIAGYIYFNDSPISKETLSRLFHEVLPAIKQMDSHMSPTEFEIITAMAFLFFSEHCDIALIETGMGGRFDTTNVIAPIISIITNIEADHRNYLGSSVKDIAFHKAGIIKEKTPVVVGEVDTIAYSVIEGEAKDKQAAIYRLGRDFHCKKIEQPGEFQWLTSNNREFHLMLSMTGDHQMKNAAIAWMGIQLLTSLYHYQIDFAIAKKAMAYTTIPGRFERIRHNPTVILDVAHNPAGVRSLIHTLKQLEHHEKKHVLFTAFNDKDYEQMIAQLESYFTTVTLTTFKHPRSLSVKEIKDLADRRKINVLENWHEACVFPDTAALYVVTGSFAFVQEARNYLNTTK